MSATRERPGNAPNPNSGEGGVWGRDIPEPRSRSATQAKKDPSSVQLQQELDHANGKRVDIDYDKPSDTYKRWSPVNQSNQYSSKQNANPPSSTSPMTPAAQANSTLTIVNQSAMKSRRLRNLPGPTNDTIDTNPLQIQTETELPSRGEWPEPLYNIVQTLLHVFRSPFFLPLCFVLALSYLISTFMAPLAEIVDIIQSAGTAIGSYFSFTWRDAGAWMHSVWNTATPPVYQIVSTGAGVTAHAVNKTTVAICSHYFGWLVVTNLGLNCPYSAPYQPLDSHVDSTLNYATLGLGQVANNAIELVPYGRQLTFAEAWLRETSYKIWESDLMDKDILVGHYDTYTDQVAMIGEEVRAYVSRTDMHLTFQRFNLRFLQGCIEEFDARIWWFRLFYPKEPYIRHQYLEFINAADDDLGRLLTSGQQCIDLVRNSQSTNGQIQQVLERNRNKISNQLDDRGLLYRWLWNNRDLTRRTVTIDSMDKYLRPVLDLLGSTLDSVRQIRTELSTLEGFLKRGRVGTTSAQLKIQMQIISSSITRLERARDDLHQRREKDEARYRQ